MNIFRIIATRKPVAQRTNNGFDSTGVESTMGLVNENIEAEKEEVVMVLPVLAKVKKPKIKKEKIAAATKVKPVKELKIKKLKK